VPDFLGLRTGVPAGRRSAGRKAAARHLTEQQVVVLTAIGLLRLQPTRRRFTATGSRAAAPRASSLPALRTGCSWARPVAYSPGSRAGEPGGRFGGGPRLRCRRVGRALVQHRGDLRHVDDIDVQCLAAGGALPNAVLIARATGAADIDPDRISIARALRIIRPTATGTADTPPRHRADTLSRIRAEISRRRLPARRHRTRPRALKRGRRNSYRVNKPGGPANTCHSGLAIIRIHTLKPRTA